MSTKYLVVRNQDSLFLFHNKEALQQHLDTIYTQGGNLELDKAAPIVYKLGERVKITPVEKPVTQIVGVEIE